MRIGVALGSGAARGLAHIPYIEAMDELGLQPSVIAGSSIGALIGSGWANGMTGAELREHAFGVLGSLQLIATTLWNRGMPSLTKLFANGISMQVDGEGVAHAFLPDGFPDDFAELKVPFHVVSTDFYAWKEVIFETGPIRPAIAASMAIPSLFRPVSLNGSYFIDGGVTNPLPLAQLVGRCDLTIGIDVQRSPDPTLAMKEPSPFDSAVVATEIMSQRIVDATVAKYHPDVFVHADVGPFGGTEFWRVREIVEHASKDKDRFKKAVDGAMAIVQLRERRLQ
ncbi:patatin-like phospholipase family protein [Devosia sp. CN2-171]|jgi:NTE family protein|uniref:patatin-like phospholipase family protein n=1 Tax=Devosia sp. CN2-171 TaxID=3400909 RepID=UPI003BF8A1C2